MVDFMEILTSTIKIIFTIFFILVLSFFVVKGINPGFRFKYWVKYKVLKTKFKPELVQLCMDTIEMNRDVVYLKKNLLLSGRTKLKEMDEITYVFEQVEKEINGGKNDK